MKWLFMKYNLQYIMYCIVKNFGNKKNLGQANSIQFVNDHMKHWNDHSESTMLSC